MYAIAFSMYPDHTAEKEGHCGDHCPSVNTASIASFPALVPARLSLCRSMHHVAWCIQRV